MAVYNGASTIKESIASVLKQDHADIELVIVDDGSKDTTADIVKGIVDERIKYFFQPNQGVSKARNLGLEHISGDYFCFLDADDIMPPKSISSRLKIFEHRPSVKFVDGRVEQRNLSTHELLFTYQPTFHGQPLKELLLLNDSCFCGQTWLIKNQFDHARPLFDGSLTHGEDLAFFIECATQGGEYAFTEDVVLIYNRHNASAMNNLDGLSRFYLKHLENLDGMVIAGIISPQDKKKVRQKVKRIMFRSYLKQGQLLKSLKFLFLR